MATGLVGSKKTVYHGPGISYVKAGEVGPDITVEIIRKEGSYYIIECTPNDTTDQIWGYVSTTSISSKTIVGTVPTVTLVKSYEMVRPTTLYAGPGSQYRSIAAIEEDTVLVVFNQSENGYTFVQFINEEDEQIRGYVHESTIYQKPKPHGYIKNSTKVYSGPGSSDYILLGTSGDRITVQIICKEGSYYEIECPLEFSGQRVRGYVTTGSISSFIVGGPTVRSDSDNYKLVYATAAYRCPGSGGVAGYLEAESIIKVCASENGYQLVEFMLNTGDKDRGYIDQSKIYVGDEIQGIIKSAYKIYSGPSSSGYKQPHSLGPNEQVKIICKEGSYYEIEYLDPRSGFWTRNYVYASYVVFITGEVPKRVLEKSYKLVNPVTAYTGPSSSYFESGDLEAEQIVLVCGHTEDGYHLIEYVDASADKVRAYVATNDFYQGDEVMCKTTAAKSVYAGPSSSYLITDKLPDNHQITLLYKDGSYYAIEYPLNTYSVSRGYISTASLEWLTGVAPVKSVTKTKQVVYPGQTYWGPGTAYPDADDILEETIVDVCNVTENGYTLIDYKGADEKSRRAFIDSSNIFDPNIIAGIVTSEKDVYSGPSSSSYVAVGKAGPNQKVTIINKESSYYLIEFEEKRTGALCRGYIYSSYLSSIIGEPPVYKAEEEARLTHPSNTYFGPGSRYMADSMVGEDDIVTLLTNCQNENGFVLIEYYDEADQLVRAYISESALHTSPPVPIGRIIAAKSLYAGPSTGYSSLGTAPVHQKVKVIQKEKSYYLIELTLPLDTQPTRCYTITSGISDIFGVVPEVDLSFGAILSHQGTIYTGPTTGFTVAGQAKEEDMVFVCEQQESGYRFIEFYDEKAKKRRGYVPSGQLYLDTLHCLGLIVTEEKIYAGPSTSAFLSLETVGPLQKVEILHHEKNYSLIQYLLNGTMTRAYIFTSGIEHILGEAETKEIPEPIGRLVHASDIYATPGTENKLGGLREDDVIGFLDVLDNGYALIEYCLRGNKKRRLYLPPSAIRPADGNTYAVVTIEKSVYSSPTSPRVLIDQLPIGWPIRCVHRELSWSNTGSSTSYYQVEYKDTTEQKKRAYTTTGNIDFDAIELPSIKLDTETAFIHATAAYSGPGQDYHLLKTYTEGEVVECDQVLMENGFTMIKYKDGSNNFRAYVPSSSLYQNANEVAGMVNVARDIYSGPSATTYQAIGTAGPNQLVKIICKEGTFFEIEFAQSSGSKIRGYIPTSYVSGIYGTPLLRTVTETWQLAKQTAGYYGPGAQYASGGNVPAETIVTVLNITESGYVVVEVELANNKKNRLYIPSGALYMPDKVIGYLKATSQVYGGPSTTYKAVAMAEAQTVTINYQEEGYYCVDFKPVGQSIKARGYLAKHLITKIMGTPLDATTANTLKLTSATLVYTGPNVEYLGAGEVDEDAIVLAFDGEESGFTLIEFDQMEEPQAKSRSSSATDSFQRNRGFVFKDTLKIASVAIIAEDATVYHGPSAGIYATIGSVNKNDQVLVKGIENGWFYIAYKTASSGEKQGYIPLEKVVNGSSLQSTVPVRQFTGYAGGGIAEETLVYAGPNKKYYNSGKIYLGEGVTIFHQQKLNGWIYLEYSTPDKTKRGYVLSEQLSTTRQQGILAKVNERDVKVYSGPDTTYASQGTAFSGEYVVIINQEDNSLYPSAIPGYDYVEFNAPSGRKRGYLPQSAITPLQSANGVPDLASAKGFAKALSTTRVYSGPGLQYNKIGSVYQGERVRTLTSHSSEEGFTYVEYNLTTGQSKRGYIPNDQLETVNLVLDLIVAPSGSVVKGNYGTSGKGRELSYYKIGNGPNVLAAVFAQHGYEDAWAADGEELYKIAAKLIKALGEDDSVGKMDDWTVYIIPTANPDGILDGWTNNGPGRTTVSTGVDTNRSFPYKFLPILDNKRNFTGPNMLGAPEALALQEQLRAWQPPKDAGEMVVLDVHGWLNQAIGNQLVGKYYTKALGITPVGFSTTGGHGYLAFWAKNQKPKIHACLIELPRPASPEDVVARDFSGKFIQATRELLQNAMLELKVPVPVTQIAIDQVKDSNLSLGQTLTISATIAPDEATEALFWTSSDPSIATITAIDYANGQASAQLTVGNTKGGPITITCSTADGSVKDTILLKVRIPATKVTITADKLASNNILPMVKDEVVQLGVIFEPANTTTTMADIIWSATDPSKVVISDNGQVRALVTQGDTYLTALVHGSSVNDGIIVWINKAIVPVTAIAIAEQGLSIKDGETQTLTCVITPESASNKTVRWSSSNNNIVAVNRYTGKITARKVGTTTITCTSSDGGKTATTFVTVKKQPVTNINLQPTSVRLAAGEGCLIFGSVEPSTATNKDITWHSSNSNLVSCEAVGLNICKLKAGTTAGNATITGSIAGEAQATVAVEVYTPATKLTIKIGNQEVVNTIQLEQGATLQLTPVIEPATASEKTITWSVLEGGDLLTVDATGKVKAATNKIGSATIEAKLNGTRLKALVAINVKAPIIPLQSVSIAPTMLIFNGEKNKTASITFQPGNATNKVITWVVTPEAIAGTTYQLEPNGTATLTVIPKALGKATITGTIQGITDPTKNKVTLAVDVREVPAQSITILGKNWFDGSITMAKNEKKWISARIEPENCTNKRIQWTITDTSKAMLVQQSGTGGAEQLVTTLITQEGHVQLKGLAVGKTLLSAQVMDQGNNAVIAYANIIISDGTPPPVEPTLEIEDPGQTVTVGYQFKPILRPPVAGETFTWTISSNVATLDATGKVTHATAGSATITCQSTITGLKATRRVTFKAEITGAIAEGKTNKTTIMYYGPSAKRYHVVGNIKSGQSLKAFHKEKEFDGFKADGQKKDYCFIETLLDSTGEMVRGYVLLADISIESGAIDFQDLYDHETMGRATDSNVYAGPGTNYKIAGQVRSPNRKDYEMEFVRVLQPVENEFVLIEYITRDGKKKRAYLPNEQLSKSPTTAERYELHNPFNPLVRCPNVLHSDFGRGDFTTAFGAVAYAACAGSAHFKYVWGAKPDQKDTFASYGLSCTITFDQPIEVEEKQCYHVEYGHLSDIALPISSLAHPIPMFTRDASSDISHDSGVLFQGGQDHGMGDFDKGKQPVIVDLATIRVEAGQIIGGIGSTGNSDGPHLHFGFLKQGGGPNYPK